MQWGSSLDSPFAKSFFPTVILANHHKTSNYIVLYSSHRPVTSFCKWTLGQSISCTLKWAL